MKTFLGFIVIGISILINGCSAFHSENATEESIAYIFDIEKISDAERQGYVVHSKVFRESADIEQSHCTI